MIDRTTLDQLAAYLRADAEDGLIRLTGDELHTECRAAIPHDAGDREAQGRSLHDVVTAAYGRAGYTVSNRGYALEGLLAVVAALAGVTSS